MKTDLEGYAPENAFIEKEYIGNLNIEEDTNTITVMLKNNKNENESVYFLLHQIFLEIVKNDF